MKNKLVKLLLLAFAGVFGVLRSRALKIVMGILILLLVLAWLWRGGQKMVETTKLEDATEQIVIEPEIEAMVAQQEEMVALLIDPEKPDEIVESPDLEYYLPPQLCEAVTSKFLSTTGRMPKDWEDIKSSGIFKKLPSPPKGYKYVYNAKFGTLEQVHDKQVAAK